MRALSLYSGGLDSQLAAKIVAQQGIEVVLVNFCTPFFGTTEAMRKSAENLGLPLLSIDVSEEYMEVLKNPRYGYGKHMNPCIDCHAFMIRQAGNRLSELGASFIITGEVLGQRPMSQNRSTLDAVAKHSGYRDLILRPLSAKLLPPSLPEREGWVDRERLLAIQGRSRETQMRLAEELGISDYPSPAGGCALTQESLSRRLKKLLSVTPSAGPDDMPILRYGRHFWLDDVMLVVGRNHKENEVINGLAKEGDLLIKVAEYPGPLALLRFWDQAADYQEKVEKAAAICARYSDARDVALPVEVRVWTKDSDGQKISVVPCPTEEVPSAL